MDGRTKRLFHISLTLLVPVICIMVAKTEKNDILWMPLTVYALYFAFLAFVLREQSADNGGDAAGLAVVAEFLLLFPLIVFSGIGNWGWMILALMIFNIAYPVIWGIIFRRNNAAVNAVREKEREQSGAVAAQKARRSPMASDAVDRYTAGLDEAYDRLLDDRRDVYPGFPWSAVFTPGAMRNILLCGPGNLVDNPVTTLSLDGIGRFKLSIQAYARYGAPPTSELIRYIEENGMNPELDEAVRWYADVHGRG